MQIRFATARDVPKIVLVINAAFAFESFFEGPRTDEKKLEEMLGKGQFLVAENERSQIVSAVYVEKRGERGYFGMLGVDPPHQGRGLGGEMIEAAENYFRIQGCKFVDICILSLRRELLPLYQKFGYAQTSTKEFHPERPLKRGLKCHEILLSKNL
jgi:GNAT superfamily N-acetyltransferase